MHLQRSLLACALLLSALPLAPAAVQDWTDIQGNVFKAEPAEALGPFALFRTPTGGGRRLPWRALPTEECARFGEQLGQKPEPAARWSDATGELTGRLRGYLRSYEQVNLVTADLDSRPEPDILIVFFVENSASGSWDMINQAVPLYRALVDRHRGHVAAIQYGVNHGPQEHGDMGLRANVPWMLVDYAEQQRITTLFRQSPRRSEFGVYALSRDGVPVFGANNPDAAAVTQFFTDANALLGLMRPTNPQSWPDRAHYLAAQHAREHANDQAGPILVGNPLVAARLKQAGIFRVEATIEVGADGKVTHVTLKDDGSIPAVNIPHLTGPLQRSAVFVPAVDHGKFVASTYHYLLEVPRD
jgi:hypothetical protein